ncbi:hypothetical protein [Enterococcus gilvus]|uniref:hypothetical protein n=1 Tax=Enterococcus gilvus TaxID=160453 RepID=UPI00345E5029
MTNTRTTVMDTLKTTLMEQAPTRNGHFFVTTCVSDRRATVWQTQGETVEKAWVKIERYLKKFLVFPKWLKIEWIDETKRVTSEEGQQLFFQVERNNYFRYGIQFKRKKAYTFLPEEIVGNALLSPHPDHEIRKQDARLRLNEKNLKGYIKRRNKQGIEAPLSFFDSHWTFFTKKGVFVENQRIYPLETEKYGQGIRVISEENQKEMLDSGIARGAAYLIDQIEDSGKFIYGYYPAYGRVLTSYNSVRHYSSLYALLEAYEYLENQGNASLEFLERIEKGIQWGLEHLTLEKDGHYYVTEQTKEGVELKLGAQAMVLLALTKYQTVTDNEDILPIIEKFLLGMTSFIAEDGSTTHVLDAELNTKEAFRIIYYDGEALFAIMRSYPLIQEDRWLELAERLMDRFIAKNYEKYHDHWLSYSVNELTRYLPKKDYFAFGVRNALGNLNFIKNRDTAYPTMLELVVAAVKMFDRIQSSVLADELVTTEESDTLKAVMEHRALHELRTGTMWPELAMFFAKPETIAGGFYCRHDRCRMRIDDAEHFLSGLINYRNLLDEPTAAKEGSEPNGAFLSTHS